jgi:photoactive yellow protein
LDNHLAREGLKNCTSIHYTFLWPDLNVVGDAGTRKPSGILLTVFPYRGRSDATEDVLADTLSDATIETMTLAELRNMRPGDCDQLPFGVIGLDASGIAQVYNATEARMAGLAPETVLGVSFFNAVAQCMNNYLVAQRFDDEPELDAIIPYVLTLRMRPTPVRMRLLAGPAAPLRYILIER